MIVLVGPRIPTMYCRFAVCVGERTGLFLVFVCRMVEGGRGVGVSGDGGGRLEYEGGRRVAYIFVVLVLLLVLVLVASAAG